MGFYIILPFIYLLALLPFWALYGVSDFMFVVVYYGLKYRRVVTETNLRNSFPGKTDAEILKISKAYYRYMCDLMLETFKTLTISKKTALKRLRFHDKTLLESLYKEHKSLILVLGHFGNWEWGGSSMSLDTDYQLYVIYHPLSNKRFDTLIYNMRSRFGTKLIPMKNTLRDMIKFKAEVSATAFIADQTPSAKNAFWIQFLNQDTPFFEGPEKVARMMDYPVVFVNIKRTKRGYYEMYTELLCEKPKETQEGEILTLFAKRLEEEIIKQPEIWLWSHRRWKHKRTEN